MPINFIKTDFAPTCQFSEWAIPDETRLVRALAWLYLRKPQHAVQIISELEPGKAGFPGRVFENAKSLLSVQMHDIAEALLDTDDEIKAKAQSRRDARIVQRDGLLFQHISWIAASISMPTALAAPPHVRKADKGFDGLLVQLDNPSGSISSLVLCEDKASTNPKKLVQYSVWKEIDAIVEGEKDLELLDAITALLRNQPHLALEELLDNLIFEQTRAFRVAVTTMPSNANAHGYQHIFDNFDSHALGSVQTRLADVLETDDTRAFLKRLARNVRREIKRIEDNV
jgi:hypothetical protein